MRNKITLMFFILVILFSLSFLFSGCGGGETGLTPDSNQNTDSEADNSQAQFADPLVLPDSDDGLSEHASGKIIVQYKSGTDPEGIAKMINGALDHTFTIGNKAYATISIPEGRAIVDTIRSFNMSGEVVYCQPSFIYKTHIVPDDRYYDRQYAPQNCNGEAAWNITTGSSSVTIAIIDTGVNGSHRDFFADPNNPSTTKMVTGHSFYDNGTDGGDIAPGVNSDLFGHGTHVAGIAGAVGNNGVGIAGVAWNCKIMPLMVFSSGGWAYDADIAMAIEWAVDNGADVINMSLGGFGYSQLMNDAIAYAVDNGVVVVTSMGNDGLAVANAPANSPGAISVGAINGRDEVTDFSTTGYHMSVTAPGQDIYSTSMEGEYVHMSGTSMSSPFVAGVCALILSAHPGITPQEVKSQLEATATDLSVTGFDPETGWGKPNMEAAVGSLQANKYGSVTVATTEDTYGATVVLYDGEGNVLSTTRTDEAGEAKFYFINPGSGYVARVFDYVTGSTDTSSTFSVTAGGNTPVAFTGLTGPLFVERFEGESFPPSGWDIVITSGHGWHISWIANDGARENYTGGYGIAAAIDSRSFGEFTRQTTELKSPVFSLSGTTNPVLYFKSDFYDDGYGAEGWLEISTDGGSSWVGTPLDTWGGSDRRSESVQIDLTSYAGETNLMLRWRYDDYGNWSYWWQIDDVFILSSPSAVPPTVIDPGFSRPEAKP